jgi:flagellar assembly factor FliW
MSSSAQHILSDNVMVESGFGSFEFDRDRTITFPKGIPGFHGYQEFGLTQLPECFEANLMLLQSIEPADLSFIVHAHTSALGLIQPEDLAEAARDLGIEEEDCGVMLITAFHNFAEGSKLSVNLRAPVLVDTAKRLAWQFVLSNDSYSVRHMLD